MQLKQLKTMFREISVITLFLLAFVCFTHSSPESGVHPVPSGQSERSFEDEAHRHSKLLLVQVPVVHFHLKEQTYKRFYEAVIQFLHEAFLPEPPKTTRVFYGIIRHLFFRKHQLLLYPFHSWW